MGIYLRLSQEVPTIILAGGDNIARGVISALKTFNLEGKIIITGQGAEPSACKYIVKGYQSMTVYKPSKKLAELAAELAFKFLKNSDTKDVLDNSANNGSFDIPCKFLETVVVDTKNLKSVVVAEGVISEKELYE
jgi:D-xylose transport system substrate-binding protein